MKLSKDERVLLTIATDYSFGVSVEDLAEFGTKHGDHEYEHQEVYMFPDVFSTKFKPIAIKQLVNKGIPYEEIKEKLNSMNTSEERSKYIKEMI